MLLPCRDIYRVLYKRGVRLQCPGDDVYGRRNDVLSRWSDFYLQPATMITCDRSNLEARCRERGYTLDEVMPCVVSRDGDTWTIDVEHPAYPRASRLPATPAVPGRGPGTELKKLLALAGIRASPDCACNARAAEMDRKGPDWCAENIGTVCGWLREQAEARGLPFLEIAAKMLVRRAIRNARRLD